MCGARWHAEELISMARSWAPVLHACMQSVPCCPSRPAGRGSRSAAHGALVRRRLLSRAAPPAPRLLQASGRGARGRAATTRSGRSRRRPRPRCAASPLTSLRGPRPASCRGSPPRRWPFSARPTEGGVGQRGQGPAQHQACCSAAIAAHSDGPCSAPAGPSGRQLFRQHAGKLSQAQCAPIFAIIEFYIQKFREQQPKCLTAENQIRQNTSDELTSRHSLRL